MKKLFFVILFYFPLMIMAQSGEGGNTYSRWNMLRAGCIGWTHLFRSTDKLKQECDTHFHKSNIEQIPSYARRYNWMMGKQDRTAKRPFFSKVKETRRAFKSFLSFAKRNIFRGSLEKDCSDISRPMKYPGFSHLISDRSNSHLYLGEMPNQSNFSYIQNKIHQNSCAGAVLSFVGPKELTFFSRFSPKRFSRILPGQWADSKIQNKIISVPRGKNLTEEQLEETFNFLDSMKNQGCHVYIHSAKGSFRATAALAAYMALEKAKEKINQGEEHSKLSIALNIKHGSNETELLTEALHLIRENRGAAYTNSKAIQEAGRFLKKKLNLLDTDELYKESIFYASKATEKEISIDGYQRFGKKKFVIKTKDHAKSIKDIQEVSGRKAYIEDQINHLLTEIQDEELKKKLAHLLRSFTFWQGADPTLQILTKDNQAIESRSRKESSSLTKTENIITAKNHTSYHLQRLDGTVSSGEYFSEVTLSIDLTKITSTSNFEGRINQGFIKMKVTHHIAPIIK